MRDNRSDWTTFTAKHRKKHLSGLEMLAGGKCSTCQVPLSQAPEGGCSAVGCPLVREEATVPRERTQHIELEHAERLAAWVDRDHWWSVGFTALPFDVKPTGRDAHERARQAQRQAWARRRIGVKPGPPDYVLMIPGKRSFRGPPRSAGLMGDLRIVGPTLCALELKAPHRAPKRSVGPEWWLEDMGTADSRYGVTREQAFWLRTMAGCGFETMVAYGADQALAWLVEQAGPKPDVLPEGWV